MRGLFAGTVDSRGGRRQLTHPDYVIFGAAEAQQPTATGAALDDGELTAPTTCGPHADPNADLERDLLTLAGVHRLPHPDLPRDSCPAHLADPEGHDGPARHHARAARADSSGGGSARASDVTHRGVPNPAPTTHDGGGPRGAPSSGLRRGARAPDGAGRRRAALASRGRHTAGAAGDGLLSAFDARLPVRPHRRAARTSPHEIAADLARTHPMHRLLQGEVGSGKTVVALRAMLPVVDAGGQAALLAPTEVLAQQHFRTMTAMLGPLADGGLLGGAARGHPVSAADRQSAGRRAPRRLARRRVRRGRHRRRHPRAAAGARRVRRSRSGRRRRAAPLRRRAARGAARQGADARRTCW